MVIKRNQLPFFLINHSELYNLLVKGTGVLKALVVFHLLKLNASRLREFLKVFALVVFFALVLGSCTKDDDEPCVYIPTLNTSGVSEVTETTATLNGTITIKAENCDEPDNSEQGFVYSSSTEPTIKDNKVLVNGENISTVLDNLEPGTQYYARSFLNNSFGEFYSNEVSLQTKTIQTCPEKYLYKGNCYESYFVGIDVDDALLPLYLTNLERFEELLASNLYTLRNPMWTIKQNGEWVIYYHIEEWKGPVTATAVSNLREQYETIANYWLEDLTPFDPEAPDEVTIKIFGFVFNEGVELDQSFHDAYGDYPVVTNWKATDESAPWQVVYKSNEIEFNQDWYRIADFESLKVLGNRKDLGSGIDLSPADWKDYTHPEGVEMFYTKFWHKTTWDAVAQRQYLKLGGVISDYANGKAGTTTLDRTFVHEMGHCFFHDDLYDPVKYPDGEGLESIMFSKDYITDFDRIVQRIIWEAQTNQ